MPASASPMSDRIEAAIDERFGTRLSVDDAGPGLEELTRIVEHCSHRRYSAQAVEPGLLRLLFACALSAPSKSDLQQADIVHVADRGKVDAIAALIPDMPWIAEAPVVLVFCGNHRRMHQIAEWRGIPFANDHLDHFMNAAVDAAIVMTTFIRAAEAVGLGTCPISAIRNKPREVSTLLGLPERVFPVAGMTLGYPAHEGRITPRLPLDATVHVDRFDDSRVRDHVDAYDARRDRLLPYRNVRRKERYGTPPLYGWSEDKARQYSTPERADFGAFIREKKFNLA